MARSHRRYWKTIAVILLLALLPGCRNQAGQEDDANANANSGPPTVLAVNYPLAFFAEQIAGDAAVVKFPAPTGVDPDYWRPNEDVIEQFQNADLVLLNGSDYAAWTKSVSLHESRVVDTSTAFRDKYVKLPDAIVHKHGPEGEHAHEGLATLTWLDPQQARQQAEAVYQALEKRIPERKSQLHSRWTALDEKLGQLEERIRQLPPPPDGKIFASHPVYDYLARFCRWDLKSMHWEPHETPGEDEWQKFAELHKQHPATIMLWEAPPTDETRARLESMNVVCVPYYPCGNRPETGDYLSIMNENIERLKAALE